MQVYLEQSENICHWSVRVMGRVLDVSPSGYDKWCRSPPNRQMKARELALVEIKAVHAEVKARYGSPRIYRELKMRGYTTSLNTVAKIMRDNRIKAKFSRKFRCTTDSNHSLPVAANILDRQFEPKAVNKAWVADITYIPTREGWLYMAAVEDLYSRRIVGWSMAERMTSRLVVDALEMAIKRRMPEEGMLAHSDRGSQYASEHYQRLLEKHGIKCSMSGVGQCWDNAPMESFFASLKKELVHHEDYETREEAKASLFEYVEVFYNNRRLHSSLGYLSPTAFEQAT